MGTADSRPRRFPDSALRQVSASQIPAADSLDMGKSQAVTPSFRGDAGPGAPRHRARTPLRRMGPRPARHDPRHRLTMNGAGRKQPPTLGHVRQGPGSIEAWHDKGALRLSPASDRTVAQGASRQVPARRLAKPSTPYRPHDERHMPCRSVSKPRAMIFSCGNSGR